MDIYRYGRTISIEFTRALLRLRPNKYQYIFCNTLYRHAVILGFLKCIRGVRVPTYCFTHTGGPDNEVQIAIRKLGRGVLLKCFYFFIFKNDRINVLNDSISQDILAIGGKQIISHITRIPNGADYSGYNLASRHEIRRIVFLGRLEPKKGFFELIEAFRTLP